MMPQVCSLHGNPKLVTIEQQLLLAEISEYDAAQELACSVDTVRKHMKECIGAKEEMLIRSSDDPFKKMMNIVQSILDRLVETMNSGEEEYRGEKISALLKVATDTLSKLDKMGRRFVPVSEKEIADLRADYDDLVRFIASAPLSFESRKLIDNYLEKDDPDG